MRKFCLIVMLLVFSGVALAQENPDPRYVGEVAAPPFPDSVDWLNTEQPLTLDGLQGKIILLDFWTYGCINCIHMIPVLAQLGEQYADELAIISVHSAKFENESETENIRQIVQRYDIHHPVINDENFTVWRSYGVNAWPTFVLIDPRGNVVARQAGEVPYDAFDRYISAIIAYYDDLGTDEINREPLEFALEGAGDPGTPLLFPGKVLVDEAGGRLFIADSNHHRIVIADLNTYEVLATIGNGSRGFRGGAYDTAQFNQPQGMALRENRLYVADVNNHAIRRVDLDAQEVVTLAGTGEKGSGIPAFDRVISDPMFFDLRSPWAVEFDEQGILHIAMAGTHQLWKMDLDANTLQASVGNGREAQYNDTLRDSELAQPSGLYYVDGRLYFADSESSTIRVADFVNDEVRVVAGTIENNLFDFGDVDGTLEDNLLQHPLGVVGTDNGNTLYFADTYNHKIKIYDAATQITQTLFGLGAEGGFRDGGADVAQFDEPGGLDYADGRLYVADTNNHAIRVIDLDAMQVSTVTFPNPEALKIERNAVTVVGGNAALDETLQLDAQIVAAGAGEFSVSVVIPEGFKLNPLIDSTVTFNSDDAAVTFSQNTVNIDAETISAPATFADGAAGVVADVTLYYCEAENEAFCLIDEVSISVPVDVSADAADDVVEIERVVIPPAEYAGGISG